MLTLIQATREREAGRRAQEENAGRLAYSVHKYTTKGAGTLRVANPIRFDVDFVEQPAFFTGLACATSVDTSEWELPSGGAAVWQWDRNKKGHYIGAFVHFWVNIEHVDRDPMATPPRVKIQHHLLFMGQAIKDLGSGLENRALTLASRPVRWN